MNKLVNSLHTEEVNSWRKNNISVTSRLFQKLRLAVLVVGVVNFYRKFEMLLAIPLKRLLPKSEKKKNNFRWNFKS